MPGGLVETEKDEKLWNEAKKKAKEQGKGDNYAYINSIYQNMKGKKGSAIRAVIKKYAAEEKWYLCVLG